MTIAITCDNCGEILVIRSDGSIVTGTDVIPEVHLHPGPDREVTVNGILGLSKHPWCCQCYVQD